jgi:hypothetical protein
MSTEPTTPSPANAANKWTLLAGGAVLLSIFVFAGIFVWEQVAKTKGRPRGDSWKRATPGFIERKAQGMATQHGLRRLGQLYLRALQKGSPPQSPQELKAVEGADDEDYDYLTAERSGEPFVIVWGLNPAQLPDGGSTMLLAWEASADGHGGRFVEMADCRTSKYLSEEQFQSTPKAKATAAQPPVKKGNDG